MYSKFWAAFPKDFMSKISLIAALILQEYLWCERKV